MCSQRVAVARDSLVWYRRGSMGTPASELLNTRHAAQDHEEPHSIPSDTATRVSTATDVLAHCPVFGVVVAGVWYSMSPSYYYHYESEDEVLCHFIVPQYNGHGTYYLQKKRKIDPVAAAPSSCANDSYPVNYYYYHGSIGYYALYNEGKGSFCSLDASMYTSTTALGSSDMNLNLLANYEATPGQHVSYIYGFTGAIWLVYRAILLTRCFISCSRYGHRLTALEEPLSIVNALVYIQQAARLAPHTATNWHRLVLVYLLAEGLMTDLFLIIPNEGTSAKLQYISLGYNIAGLLSMLFEIVETTKFLKPTTRLLVKRLLFNSELSMWGELVFSFAMAQYLIGLNRSQLGQTRKVGEAVSFYVWGLVNHAIIVSGQSSFILTVRVVGTIAYTRYRFGSLKVLVMPCCVDAAMGFRYKLATISGYEIHNARLYYASETLKAHGLLKIASSEGDEYLVYHKIHWLPTAREDLAVVGKLTDEHVEACPEKLYAGPVSVCDRLLGGEEHAGRLCEGMGKLESAHLVESWR